MGIHIKHFDVVQVERGMIIQANRSNLLIFSF